MNKLLSFAIVALAAGTANASIVISEFAPNQPGADEATQTIELSGGDAGAAFDLWFLSIEDDGDSGLVDRVNNITGTFDANGLATAVINDLENPSNTVLLVEDFTGDTSTDIDTDNDGVVDDTSSFTGFLDSLGIPDDIAEVLYSTQLGGSDLSFIGSEPVHAFRDGVSGEWYAVNFADEIFDAAGNMVDASTFDSNPAAPSFGSINPTAVPEPSSLGVIGLGLFAFARRRRN